MENDKLCFFSKSADKAPGRGVHEFVRNPAQYHELSSHQHWRRQLSNFWIAPFPMFVHGKEYNFPTIEHAYHASRLAIRDPAVIRMFTVGQRFDGDGLAALKQRKFFVLTPAELEQWEKIQANVFYEALYAKFSQPGMMEILLATGNAELWHAGPRIPLRREKVFEQVREELMGIIM